MDLKLDGSGDIALDEGDAVLVEGLAAIVQHLRLRLRLFKGEWFLDQRLGLPFFETVLVKRPNLNLVRSILRQAILETPGVHALLELSLEVRSEARSLAVVFTVQTEAGPWTAREEITTA